MCGFWFLVGFLGFFKKKEKKAMSCNHLVSCITALQQLVHNILEMDG